MSLRHTYSLWAPVYDPLVEAATLGARRRSLERLAQPAGHTVLLCGVGTGLDIPHLPAGPRYVGVDLTPAMLSRARRRADRHDVEIELHEGDVMSLDLPDGHFDAIVMHLILAVVPDPEQALREAARVLKPGGRLIILDKFLRPGAKAPLRRTLNVLLRHLATRTDVVFEALLEQVPGLMLMEDSPALGGGWFRHIVLEKIEAADRD